MERAPDRSPWVTRKRFREIVAEALDTIPPELSSHLANVAVFVEDEPEAEILREMGYDPEIETLYGLYQGTPLGERALVHDALPDRIVIYFLPLVEDFTDEYHLRREIRRTVVHEVGHFFGFDDDRLEELGF
jgi:predicted Zn-dependent protease with MMP-like domain